jgi:1-acyl-sn-glycerol-3-phosphate acyltransferase
MMTRAVMERVIASAVTLFARFVTGVRGNWAGCLPDPRPRVYFGNHRSHGDFVLIWTVLPRAVRRATRPVAGADYWLKGAARRFIGERVFRAVLIDRTALTREVDPISLMVAALDEGSSLIFFPEGTRNTTEESLLAFRAGLYHLARSRPDIELVPVWIDNLNRVMPKGEVIPVPLLCTVTFGMPIRLEPQEERKDFLARARASLLSLAPVKDINP